MVEMNASRARAFMATLVVVLATATVAVVSTLGISGQLGNDGGADRTKVCAAARVWRDAAQAFEVTSNKADRRTAEGRRALGDGFKFAANVVFPSSGLTKMDSRLVGSVEEWNSAAETWWFSLYDSSSVSSAKQNSLILALNEKYRKVNPYLVDVCGVPAIELYTE